MIDLFVNNEVRQLTYDEPVAVIGDIHGRSDLLDALLPLLGDVHVLVMGDLCDRGTDTPGVVERLIAIGAQGVRGNHEDWFLQWTEGRGFDTFALHPQVGGATTLAAYGVQGRTPREIERERFRVPLPHREFLNRLALAIDLRVCGDPYWLVHAGVPPREELSRIPKERVIPWLADHYPADLVWGVTQPDRMPAVDRPVVMGHVALTDPVDTGDVVAIDTGAGALGKVGRLTAVVLPQRKFVTVGPDEARAVAGTLAV